MKQMKLLTLFAVATVGAAAFASISVANEPTKTEVTAEKPKAAYSEIDAGKLQSLLGSENVVVFDSRSAEQYAEGHIPGALPLRASEATGEKLAELVPGKDATLVFYCGNRQCPASAKTAHSAAEAGYTNLYKYTDGIEDWQAKGLPVETSSL